MNQYLARAKKRAPRITIIMGMVLIIGGQAHAEALGRLHFTVRNAADEKPLGKAKIVIKDPSNAQKSLTLISAADGTVTTAPLEAKSWKVTAELEEFQVDTREVIVVAETITEVEILLEPLKEEVIKIKADKSNVNSGSTGQSRVIERTDTAKAANGGGNPQSLIKMVRGNPGLVEDSAGQVHPRGEHSATSIYLNGVRLPSALQGHSGQIISPGSIETFDIMTGAYAPEFGGETAAIMNLTLRTGVKNPFQEVHLQTGSFKTFFGELNAGGEVGIGSKRLGYFLNLSGRSTSNTAEPPQPNLQSAHNSSNSYSGFGHFKSQISAKDNLSLSLGSSPARSEVANRTGLPDSYAPYGQGYGYQGILSRNEAEAQGIPSQQVAGQDIYQRDSNEFMLLSLQHAFNPSTSGLISVGLVHAGLDVLNNNPVVNLTNLPANSSIEFSPTIIRNSHTIQLQGNVTKTKGRHAFKVGFGYDSQTGDESYQLIPGSQAAATDLFNIDPRLAITNGRAPNIFVHRRGYYASVFAQDTFHVSNRLTLNYGLRYDEYKQDSDSRVDTGDPTRDSVNSSLLSPRVNAAYVLAPKTIARASYNKLFQTPPQAQGSVVGSQIQPETLDQYEISVEREVKPRQVVKVSAYYKDIRNQIDTGLLIPGTQIGVLTSVNLDRGSVHGFEFSYDWLAKANRGWSGYIAWSNSIARPGGFDNAGNPVDRFNDHDQLNTISGGATYTFADGSFWGVSILHGSGVASSPLADGLGRSAHTEVNFVLASRPKLIGSRFALQLDVANLFDSRSRLNFNSAFSGTRFQQGRSVMISLVGKF